MNHTPTPTACCGPCNGSWRRAEKQRLTTGAPHDLTPRAGEPVWCPPCARHLHAALAALPDLVARLFLEMENASPNASEHVSGSRERPIHERERYVFCIDDIDGVLDDWATAVREDRHLATSRPARQGPRIAASVVLLLVHFDWLMSQHPDPEASAAFGTDIAHVHRHATGLTHTGDVRPERCDGVPCPRCDLLMLEHEVDWQGRATGYIACRGCGTLLSAPEYERWLKLAAAPLRGSAAA